MKLNVIVFTIGTLFISSVATADIKLIPKSQLSEAKDSVAAEVEDQQDSSDYEKDMAEMNNVSNSIADQLAGRRPASVEPVASGLNFTVTLVKAKKKRG